MSVLSGCGTGASVGAEWGDISPHLSEFLTFPSRHLGGVVLLQPIAAQGGEETERNRISEMDGAEAISGKVDRLFRFEIATNLKLQRGRCSLGSSGS
ncbi:hypothetical protein ACSSVY_002746 [Roseovarius sp. MBR-51]